MFQRSTRKSPDRYLVNSEKPRISNRPTAALEFLSARDPTIDGYRSVWRFRVLNKVGSWYNLKSLFFEHFQTNLAACWLDCVFKRTCVGQKGQASLALRVDAPLHLGFSELPSALEWFALRSGSNHSDALVNSEKPRFRSVNSERHYQLDHGDLTTEA